MNEVSLRKRNSHHWHLLLPYITRSLFRRHSLLTCGTERTVLFKMQGLSVGMNVNFIYDMDLMEGEEVLLHWVWLKVLKIFCLTNTLTFSSILWKSVFGLDSPTLLFQFTFQGCDDLCFSFYFLPITESMRVGKFTPFHSDNFFLICIIWIFHVNYSNNISLHIFCRAIFYFKVLFFLGNFKEVENFTSFWKADTNF